MNINTEINRRQKKRKRGGKVELHNKVDEEVAQRNKVG
jgi:hypothetical protein